MAARKRKKKAARSKSTRSDDVGGSLWAPRLGIVSLRLFIGGLWLQSAHIKLFGGEGSLGENIAYFRDAIYDKHVRRGIEQPAEIFGQPLTFFADFLEHVMLPARHVMAPAILFFEILLGLSLVLGLGVRLMATLGALMTLAFALARSLPFFTVKAPNFLLVFAMLALALMAAGRVGGLDRRMCRRWPGWIS